MCNPESDPHAIYKMHNSPWENLYPFLGSEMLKRNVSMLLVIICNPRISPLLFILSVLTLLKHSSRLPARKHFLRQTVSNLTSAQRFLKIHFSSLKYYKFFKIKTPGFPLENIFWDRQFLIWHPRCRDATFFCKLIFPLWNSCHLFLSKWDGWIGKVEKCRDTDMFLEN